MTIVSRQLLVLTVTALLTACNAFGPDALRGTHPLYNDAIVHSMNDQFIQNVVRLHYRDPVFFLLIIPDYGGHLKSLSEAEINRFSNQFSL